MSFLFKCNVYFVPWSEWVMYRRIGMFSISVGKLRILVGWHTSRIGDPRPTVLGILR